MASVSQCRQNYDEKAEAAINKQINMELYASYTYQSMAYHFSRDDIALPGFHKYFKHQSDEEREHSEKFMKYQNSRGGRLVFQPVAKPTKMEWASGLEALEDALALEREVNESLLQLHKVAEEVNDPHLQDFLEGEFLTEQVDSIKEIGDMVTQARRCGPGLGEYQFDQLTMQKK